LVSCVELEWSCRLGAQMPDAVMCVQVHSMGPRSVGSEYDLCVAPGHVNHGGSLCDRRVLYAIGFVPNRQHGDVGGSDEAYAACASLRI
jgi:hypothetical protein